MEVNILEGLKRLIIEIEILDHDLLVDWHVSPLNPTADIPIQEPICYCIDNQDEQH
jgi:hypothetical protein